MSKALTVCLIIVGLINFAPTIGIFSASQIEQAYSINLSSHDMEILLRHRALLFGILGGFILYSAFFTIYQGAALLMGGLSMVGYAAFVLSIGGYNESIFRILIVDIVGVVFLTIAVLIKYVIKSS